jgi:secondary thiamine-phosphate synthase enzyme
MDFTVQTQGHYDFIDITERVEEVVKKSGDKQGAVLVFVPATTAAITAMEYEAGGVKDLVNIFEDLAPENTDYEHHKKWGDHNGAAHLKTALIGPDLTVPLRDGKILLGTWQRIVLIDFDEKPRERRVTVEILPV